MQTTKNQNGSILILVLFALTTLSLLAFSVGYTVRQKMQVVKRLEAREKLRLAAGAAIQQASILMSEKIAALPGSYQALNQIWSSNPSLWKKARVGSVEYFMMARGKPEDQDAVYGLTDEDRKMNLNSAKPHVLQKLFEIAGGVEREEARRLVAAIRDWKDEDEDITDGGAESKDYLSRPSPYRSKNALFDHLQELLWVQGMNPEIFSRVKPYLTLDATKVNLNTASTTVMTAMGLSSTLADKVVLYRQGKDGKESTTDDGVFKSLAEAPDVLSRYIYLNEVDRQNIEATLASGFSVQATFFNAELEGHLDHQTQQIKVQAILDNTGKVIRWHEDFI